MTLTASLAGCGAKGTPNNGTGDQTDMSMAASGNDSGAPPKVDMTVTAKGANTGELCKAAGDCSASLKGSKATCTKTKAVAGTSVSWPDGYCQAPCNPGNNDMSGINTTECPGDNTYVCSPGDKTCYIACTGAADCDTARNDGKMNYVCANVTSALTGVCVPLGSSSCDPTGDPRPQMKSCMAGQKCQSYSQDNSYGTCADICDPVAQNCPAGAGAPQGCVADVQMGTDGSGTCIGAPAGMGPAEGDPCTFLNSCSAGYQCLSGKCHHYCRTGGGDGGAGPACPMGQTCKDIPMAKFKATMTGLCQ
jgi:hypothetical protein